MGQHDIIFLCELCTFAPCELDVGPCTPSLVVDPTSLVDSLPKPDFLSALAFLCLLPAVFLTFLKPRWQYIQYSTKYMPCTVAIV